MPALLRSQECLSFPHLPLLLGPLSTATMISSPYGPQEQRPEMGHRHTFRNTTLHGSAGCSGEHELLAHFTAQDAAQ